MTDPDLKSFTSQKLQLQNALMLDSRLSAAQKIVAVALLTHANSKTGAIFPSQDLLAVETGYSARHVRSCIKAIEDCGWLDVERSNRQLSNRYTFRTQLIAAIEDQHLAAKEALIEARERRKAERNKLPDRHANSSQDWADRNTSSALERKPSSSEHCKVTPPFIGKERKVLTTEDLELGTEVTARASPAKLSNGDGERLAPLATTKWSHKALPAPADDQELRHSVLDELDSKTYHDWPLRNMNTFQGKPIVPPNFGSPLSEFRPMILRDGGDWIVADDAGRPLSRHATEALAFREVDRLTSVQGRKKRRSNSS